MDQLNLFDTLPTESWVFEQISPALLQVISNNNLSCDKLRCESGKNYSSVWYDSQMVFRICLRGDYHYFGVSDAFTGTATEFHAERITKNGRTNGFTNYSFAPNAADIQLFSTFLASVLDQSIDGISKEFDCCSRFEECSNAKKCIHPNSDFAAGCGYRKIMKKGRIFYGQNRNTD